MAATDRRRVLAGLAAGAAAAVIGLPPAAGAQVPARPIPEGPGAGRFDRFLGSPARAAPVRAPEPPRHPFMAPNGRSNIHADAYQTDSNRWAGPLGLGIARRSSFQAAECASHTFDRAGRLVTICIGLEGPRLVMFDPRSLATLAVFPLPPRDPAAGDPFTGFSGGGYFYLDHRDRAVIPTTNRQLWVVREAPGPSFALARVYDVGTVVPPGDEIVSALPDWRGLLWFVSEDGVVGTVDPATGAVRSRELGEGIANSFAVDDRGGVYIVSNAAIYRFDGGPGGAPEVTWRRAYLNTGVQKPGQVSAGSGTTPTLMGRDLVAFTDNADPMNIVVLKRARTVTGSRRVCRAPLFRRGASATDNSPIGTDRSLVIENNYGYRGPGSTQGGRSTARGLERVDVDRRRRRCVKRWKSFERAPSVVAKLSRATGLVYTYTKPVRRDGEDLWYLTALDFRSGRTVWKRLAGEGLGYNNNYAPITLGPDGAAYVGVLGGIVRLADTRRPGARTGPRFTG